VFGRVASLIIPAGEYVTVVVISEPADTFDDLLAAAESSLGFWDNPCDDEDWNDA
jgi:glutamine amidotransferase PdxT